jgi:streptogramin lyase
MVVKATVWNALLVFAALSWMPQNSAANGVALSGTVKDASGAPLRGALVKLSDGSRYVARFSDAKGAYRVEAMSAGKHQVSVSHRGFAEQSQEVSLDQSRVAHFRLNKQFNRMQLTSAEILTTLPQNREVQWLKVRCIACHGMTQPEHLRGANEQALSVVFKSMQMNYGNEWLTAEDIAYGVKLSQKYFGPDSPQPTEATVRRAPISDAALKATFYGMDLKVSGGRAFPHSITADQQGSAWVAEFGAHANRITKWNPEAGTLESVPINIKNAAPHTPAIDQQGRIWTALQRQPRVTVIDPRTRAIEYLNVSMQLPHTHTVDDKGFVWGNGTKIYRIDPQTRNITYWNPLSAEVPKGSWGDLAVTPGMPKPKAGPLYAYHVVRDSKGFAWYSSLETGLLVKLDPQTGQQQVIKIPGVLGSRGFDIDASDTLWLSNWGGHSLIRYDTKTGRSKSYGFPTQYAMPYSVFVDHKRGYVWASDYNGNNLTRFDPRTETFVEFPMPHNESYPRFISLDERGRVWFAEWWNSRVGLLDPGYDSESIAMRPAAPCSSASMPSPDGCTAPRNSSP